MINRIRRIRTSIKRFFRPRQVKFQLRPKLSFKVLTEANEAFMYFKEDVAMTEEMDAFLQNIEGKKCFLDVGALYGVFSMAFLTRNPDARVISFEPSTHCRSIIERHIKINKLNGWHPEFMALGHETKNVSMMEEWHHFVVHGASGASKSMEVPMTKLDDYVKYNSIIPDIIKIDVEGYEQNVLLGASEVIEKFKPVIFLELHGEWILRHGYSHKDVVSFLTSRGYKFYNLDGSLTCDLLAETAIFGKRLIAKTE